MGRIDGRSHGALVCFPYAGGNAMNFQPMARALRGSGLAVYAVELPGHDVAASSESFAPMERVVDQVVAEITARGLKRSCCGDTPPAPPSPSRRPGGCRGGGRCRGCSLARSCSVPPLTGAPPSPISADAATPRSSRELSADSGYTELGELDANAPSTSVRRTATTTCRRTAISPRSWITRRREGCPRRSPWWLPPTTRSRRGSSTPPRLGAAGRTR